MKKTNFYLKSIAIFLSALILFTSCVSTTKIESTPSGAKVYINKEFVGNTPYVYKSTKVSGSHTPILLKKEGYKDLFVDLRRNEKADAGAIVGGIFLLFPFIWTMKYKPVHNYELTPTNGNN